MFQLNSNLKIVATILAKDEEDIIGKNIEHHINQGVKHFIITNNRSKDKTKNIIESYPEVCEIIEEQGEDHNQSEWVTKMARLACKLKPDWIIHLDADEFWCGLNNLKNIPVRYVSSPRMFLHPPAGCEFDQIKMRYYLDFENFHELPGECKVAHRPDPDIVIKHGNHSFDGINNVHYANTIWRHHYPIRSYSQFIKKAVEGHESLLRRGAICDRWKKWYDLYNFGLLEDLYKKVCQSWSNMIKKPNKEDLANLLEFWSTPDTINYIIGKNLLPNIGEWPKKIIKKEGRSG